MPPDREVPVMGEEQPIAGADGVLAQVGGQIQYGDRRPAPENGFAQIVLILGG